MQYRRFGRTGWQVSEVGCGMWAMGGGWSGGDENESYRALERAVQLGCDFFDTAWAYGEGRSERLLRKLLRAHPRKKLYAATKVPPKNFKWPGSPKDRVGETYPPDHIRDYAQKSRENLGVETIDLLQLHVWDDAWAKDDGWQRCVDDLKREKVIQAFGISVNRWEPANVLRALDTGLVDAVQVIYNVFDQSPEDALFPRCKENDIAVIARVPFDEGSLTGKLTKTTKFPPEDWRSRYFCPENLRPTLVRVDRLKPLVPAGMSMSALALRFILAEPAVSTVIPGMRKPAHVEENIGTSDGKTLPEDLRKQLRAHRWDRAPAPWSA